MLKSLDIQNYTLIESLSISFENGFSVITGETGAGKSIILGAINLLLGQRADSKAIRTGAKKCVIEAHFDLRGTGLERFFTKNDFEFDNGECIVRRELLPNGKSRAFINDTPAQLAQLKELGEQLIDIHSQHQNLLLNNETFQLDVLDIMAHNEALHKSYYEKYLLYEKAVKEMNDATNVARKNEEEIDFLKFQYRQLVEAALDQENPDELEQESDMLTHSEEIKSALFSAKNLLNGEEQSVVSSLKSVIQQLNRVEQVYSPCAELVKRLNSSYIEIRDIASEIEAEEDNVEFNPDRLEYVNARLSTFNELERKYAVSDVPALIALRDDLEKRLNLINNYDDELLRLQHVMEAALSTALKDCHALTESRKQVLGKIEQQMISQLVSLGMPNVQFKVSIQPSKDLGPRGGDCVEFLFNANRGGTLQDITLIASGGEIARVMLSLKALIAGAVKLPTIIFDEIDTGVSGHIAEKMALIMKQMGEHNRQVISITHLPQIAAKGQVHYKVYKDDKGDLTTSHIVRMSKTERIEEIAHMLSGANLTDAAISNAKELLK